MTDAHEAIKLCEGLERLGEAMDRALNDSPGAPYDFGGKWSRGQWEGTCIIWREHVRKLVDEYVQTLNTQIDARHGAGAADALDAAIADGSIFG